MNMTEEQKRIKELFAQQMQTDYCCSGWQLNSTENEYTIRELKGGRRRFKKDDAILKVLCMNGKCIFSGREEILEECRTTFKDLNGAWMSQYKYLYWLDDLLLEHKYFLEDLHHYYLPLGKELLSEEEMNALSGEYEVQWYEGEEIERFRDDERFIHAYSFLPNAPDVLGVAVLKNGEILGMAGASADSDVMWQIGIDVMSESKGMNLGPFITILLKREILKRGKVPYYGTVESHIQSQKVAVKAGFLPYWAELNSAPLPEDTEDSI
ncbi:MAG: GNAT family N-acetyltransferase [Lachnospiraceae bacterium]|nr:GNAT family N-acetyltransferase [Lachnospiraceae bacterium]